MKISEISKEIFALTFILILTIYLLVVRFLKIILSSN